MLEKIREKLLAFVESDKDMPLLAGFVIGIYPFLFFYSNNYPSVNTWQHFAVFFCLYVGLPVIITVSLYAIFNKVDKLRPYKKYLLFVLLVFLTSVFMSQAIYLTLKKKVLLGILIIACVIAIKLNAYYKRIIVIIAVMATLPLFKCIVHIYEDTRPMEWANQPDDIADVKFKHRPNIYMIQPDGYVSREVLESAPYNYKTDFYDWLADNNFTIYKNFRSNYPASLTSNASMFAMKHHYFDDLIFPAIEMPNAREAIMNNNAVAIFKNNGYETFYIGHDEYFQQNLTKGNYSHYNIKTQDIPLLTNGGKLEREVYHDLEKAMDFTTGKPKFYFVEKVLPHHVHFDAPGDRKKAERQIYLDNLEDANTWLKKTITMINGHDKNALIFILADHGGWVGVESMNELLSTGDTALINSTFGNLAAIQWGGINHTDYDKYLKSNVNVFRVLFSCLSENKSYLNHLEEDASYNIRPNNFITQSVNKLIDKKGNIVNEKY